MGTVEKIQNLAKLAGREGNTTLAQKLSAKADELDPWVASSVVTLPAAESLTELWDILGFEKDNIGRHVVTGVHRRLSAALSSIRSRGFVSREFHFDAPDRRGRRQMLWESQQGAWSHRHWRVTALVVPTHDGVTVANVTIAVKSSAAADAGHVEWTAFKGRALNSVISQRLAEVLAVLAVRHALYGDCCTTTSINTVPLTEDELDAFHDLHPSPTSAMMIRGGRVVLWDDASARAHLEGACPATSAHLALTALSCKRLEDVDIDVSIPKSERLASV